MQAIFQMGLEAQAPLTAEEASEPDNPGPSRMLLFVHAAAHDAAARAVTAAAAQHSVTLQLRSAALHMLHSCWPPYAELGIMLTRTSIIYEPCILPAWKGAVPAELE